MVAPADSWVPGYRFVAGKLLIFERERVTLVKGWPEPEAATKPAGGRWQSVCPEFRLVRPYRRRKPKPPGPRQLLLPIELPPTKRELDAQKRRAFEAFRFALPPDLGRAIERFQSDQFALIRMFCASGAFLDLLRSNPPLAFYFANQFGRARVPDAATQLLARKQTELLRRLGFPSSPAVVKAVRKVEPESVCRANAELLRNALADDDARAVLSHLPVVNAGVMKLLGSDRLRVSITPSLLEEVALDRRERYRAATADLLLDVLALHRELRGTERAPQFRSTERLANTHHSLSEEYVARKQAGILDCVFPPPPVRGTPDIVALIEPRELIREGLRQRNCVASYAPAVARGDVYIYRVLRPERATLAVRPAGAGSRYYVSELWAACNLPVKSGTQRAVARWLDERTISA